tara:strand:- start:5369 stop:8701 length:3333 start_codon:yes stop_codon:yes gene_type:complete
MSIDVALSHITEYKYDRFVNLGPQIIRLRPAPHTKSKIISYSLNIFPDNHFINWQQDPFSNYQARVFFPDKVKFFKVQVDLITQMNIFNPFDFFLEDNVKTFPFDYPDLLKSELQPYFLVVASGSIFFDFIQEKVSVNNLELVDFLVLVNTAINSEIKYNIRLEPGIQTPEKTLEIKSGSCRDMAWLACQIFRHLGLAARFCSGYLIQLKADVIPHSGPKGPESDFSDLHAWVEVFLPGAGWIGLDPSSGLFAGEGHIPLSCTPTPSSAAPISGSLGTCETEFSFNMQVNRLQETPRSTKPYTDKQWQDILTVGKSVDTLAEKQDIKLTIGGEPTFVSAQHIELDEWNTAALGEHKETIAQDLIVALQNQYSKGALLQCAQGKWYPGEILPRWSYGCYWRKDNENIWENQDLLAISKENNQEVNKTQFALSDAENLINEISSHLGVHNKYIQPVFEDVPYHVWKKQFHQSHAESLGVSTFELTEANDTNKVLENEKMLPVGYVLPLNYGARKNRWISCAWEFNSEQLFLNPGSSPLGLRLPINQLPYQALAKEEIIAQRPYSEMNTKLPSREHLIANLKKYIKPLEQEYPSGFLRTALSIELRDNQLYVFMPPISLIEHYLELIAVIELSALKFNLKVTIEGYPPPLDLRINYFKITPDPGVLEVNIQPTSSWEQLTDNIKILYHEAKLLGLEAEKFLTDGKKVGTGGGNHIVLGANSPLDSPFLRRPDVLVSMITFWQNHPSLSYLFSSIFIGPTSQSPRVDEARHDSLYELEIAFQQINRKTKTPYWKIDRLFRNLLVDIAGNTHRSEFCIDKLYSPEGETGRLGLLELRSFEMPPHYKMSSVQYLLIKSLVTLFWDKPHQSKFKKFGTQLHDKFMLPTFLAQDFKQVIEFLNESGIPIKYEWFVPFVEFRFQRIGSIVIEDIEIELRTALEPWPVMGEETTPHGTSRMVDSSLERIQCKVTGLLKPHHVITCNGYKLPLQRLIGSDEQYVCGVRFKAWPLTSALHPNLPVNSPLTFDIFDTRYKRSIGGCKYHVFHPGGRSYDTFPVNENEAQGRRLSRFEKMGHTPGEDFIIHEYSAHADFPYTLDLRRTIADITALNKNGVSRAT